MRACLEVVWPNLYALLQDNSIEAVDLAMTEMITRHLPDGGSEELASFICYLVAATRQGHLCVMVGQGELLPDPLEVVAKPCQGALFTRMALDGAMAFLSVHCKERLSSLITVYSCYVYLSRYAEIECICAEEIKRLAALSLTLSLKDDDLSPRLTSQQRKAVLTSLSSPFSLITGGPGTGKTFTAAELVRAFCCRLEHRGPPSILLAAPTGKAAAHLEKNVKKHIEFDAHISCGTLHALLSMHARRSGTRQGAPLCYDLMIVDEASMIDAALMRECLASVPLRGQLVLMGDPDQLPPVEVGSLFPELIKAAKEGAGIVFSELTECLRSDRKAILSLASAVNEQKETEALAILAAGDAAIQKRDFLDPETPDGRSYEALMRFVEPFFFYVLQGNLAPIEVLKQLDKFKVISCLRKGLHGVDTLNSLLLSKYYAKAEAGTALFLPIMIAKNDYSLGLFNGDVGVILCVKEGDELCIKEGDTAYFEDRQQGGIKKIAALSLPSYEYAFCLSVHKSQGSEYDEVLILLPSGSEVFGRQALYTGITRAKNKVTISAAPTVFEDIVGRCSRKISGLHARLKEKGEL